jgi:hypothetical protein
MKNKISAFLVIGLLFAAQLACHLPSSGQAGDATQLPAPNQTLTALFAITPASDGTATLPPIVTATSSGTVPTATLSPASPTATLTTAPNPTVTNTRPPEPTATIPSARTRSMVVAKYLTTPPTLDGDWSEWKDTTKEYPANSVVWGAANWTGEEDLSSSFHIGWDNNYLYIAVKIHDDKYVQNASGANLYKGDSLELLLDANLQADYFYQDLSPDDFQLGISPGRPDPDGAKEAYLWFPNNIAGKRSSVNIGSRLEDGIYRVEAAIPWDVFEMTPVNGRNYGFALSVSDNDDPNNNIQQSMVSNINSRHLTDPTTWGDLQLVK